MFINKLLTIKGFGECEQFIGNEVIRNVMGRWRFEDIFRNLQFLDNAKERLESQIPYQPV